MGTDPTFPALPTPLRHAAVGIGCAPTGPGGGMADAVDSKSRKAGPTWEYVRPGYTDESGLAWCSTHRVPLGPVQLLG